MSLRLDKWLWAARFFKTRALARNAIEGGKVHVNNLRAKPSKTVEIGMTLVIRQGLEEKTIVIQGLMEQRRGAPEAEKLYQETAESLAKREELRKLRKLQATTMPTQGRPTKKQRRQIIRFKHQNDLD